jgi:predicted lactoylglutathione lyase
MAWGNHELFVFEDPASTRNLHIAFVAPTREHVDTFWRTGTEAGYRDDGPPGLRPQYAADYYGGFLLDPDGNSAEAVHGRTKPGGAVDHMWIRVADLDAASRFYEELSPYTGFRRAWDHDDPPRVGFADGTASFSVVKDGAPTENLHLAFPACDNETVDEFHRAATSAGYADNGAPGEREYHPGYYAAFVLDPDGNNVEVVNHNRD